MNDLNRYFVDTNILVYAYDTSAGRKHAIAKELILDLWNSNNGCLSVQVFQEFFIVTTQKVSNPLPINEVKQIISDLTFWRVHTPNSDDILSAIDLKEKYQISFWDAMIITSAKKFHCKKIFTEDLNHDQFYDGIQIENPFNLN